MRDAKWGCGRGIHLHSTHPLRILASALLKSKSREKNKNENTNYRRKLEYAKNKNSVLGMYYIKTFPDTVFFGLCYVSGSADCGISLWAAYILGWSIFSPVWILEARRQRCAGGG